MGAEMTAPLDSIRPAAGSVGLVPETTSDSDMLSRSHDAIALAFSQKYDGSLIYVNSLKQWFRSEGGRWHKDDTLRVSDLVRAECRAAAKKLGPRSSLARDLASAGTVAAVERLARSDLRHARRAEDFDIDPWALNTPDGVIDLQSGHVRSHRAGDLFSKITAVGPHGDCPRFRWFLSEICGGDADMVGYLQRMIGYTLSGVIREHVFVFLWGPGGNGKSVLLSTIAAMLGDYAVAAMSDVFTVGRHEHHPTHLAAMRGARMVVVSEVEGGRPWAEARIKNLTGGDRVSARVMRGDTFEFSPEFKLWIAGNSQPALRSPDAAMRRRLHIVPLTFVPQRPDPSLTETLRAELPGILAFALEGCLAWHREGINPPLAVLNASEQYFMEQDRLANWIAARCEPTPKAELPVRSAYLDWKITAEAGGEEPGSEKRFSSEMGRQFDKRKLNTGMVFIGVQLRYPHKGS